MFLHTSVCLNSRVRLSLRFLNVKIQEGDAHNIFCPAYECYQLVPVHVIESVVSREMDQRYLQFDIKVENTNTHTNLALTMNLCCVSLHMHRH